MRWPNVYSIGKVKICSHSERVKDARRLHSKVEVLEDGKVGRGMRRIRVTRYE
jgi:hypothetical protein